MDQGYSGNHHGVQRSAIRESLVQEPEAIGWCQKSRGGIPGRIVVHTIALDSNNIQATYFAKAARTTRFAYF
ncbi:hypothetical protein MFUM_200072 [Methylacidiphilum fumariolicum SolV]|uniref:Uncharacterized protein n=2 Tax=Candidatus Methylacidiphilum fumarolicum TaxID=591154 RepID=I0JWY8_METFB|nr:conserved protein of unknown function [Candidatus Methylacidiphilum fumarolicum]CCG91757.1 hypothetical protein MFUM_200072 [Methylacidiphilum fumariolicum SolV]